MANNRIGCSAGKTSLIDPNNFSGQGSADNISVPLEDLTISVQLETIKKGRTILTTNNIGENSTKSTQNSNNVRVTFIEGTEIGGQKVLSSKFTDLTTVFDKDNDSSENLGITNIDIDFNSSYAPLITINFLDLRGSSIFQNESQLNNNENKYSVFFQLPYPLYELTIKGYYGKPVKYCLHMTKFNSKFNSQTGNFEITGNFIGYTYAMLSDMLLGILKAIPYTKKGGKKYKDLKAKTPSLLNLNELMIKIEQIDKNLEKIGAGDPDAARLTYVDSMLSQLASMKVTINNFGSTIDYKTDLTGEEAYNYIAIFKHEDGFKDDYNKNVSKIISEYNKNEKDAKTNQILDLNTYVTTAATKTLSNNIQIAYDEKFDSPSDFTAGVSDRKDIINDSSKKFNVYNMSPLFSDLNSKRIALELIKKDLKLKLGVTIKNSITKSLSFPPTIRNIVNVFTVAVEVYLSVMLEVSNDAEIHKERYNELKLVFTKNENSDLKSTVKYYPWPDYRENDAKQGYTEKYLGASGVLRNPSLVDELFFIDDLYNGFLKAKSASDEAILQGQMVGNTWIPINPFDTLIYNQKAPYDRLPTTSISKDITTVILVRMMTFLGYTHDSSLITPTDIENIATAEANGIIRSKVLSEGSINGLKNDFSFITPTNIDNIVTVQNKMNGNDRPILTLDGDYYSYTYVNKPPLSIRVLPISDDFFNDSAHSGILWSNKEDELYNKKIGASSDGIRHIFLTNYTREKSETKPLDGGRYIDIININEYDKIIGKGLSDPIGTVINITKLSDLKNGNNAAYSIFNGPYGMQEFKNMDYGQSNLSNAPLKYLFYAKKIFIGMDANSVKNKALLASNFVSYGRKATYIDQDHDLSNVNNPPPPPPSPIQIQLPIPGGFGTVNTTLPTSKPSVIYTPKNQNIGNKLIEYPENVKMFDPITETLLHSNQSGDNLLDNIYVLNLNNDALAYPYIELQKGTKPISLFGSKLYYFQKGSNAEYSKAFLFLNTLPFNGTPFSNDKTSATPAEEGFELTNLFNKTGGFIHAPRLWCVWVGSLIWRAGLNVSSPYFGKPDTQWKDPIEVPKADFGLVVPNIKEYYKPINRFEYFKGNFASYQTSELKDYKDYSELFKFLPQEVLENFYEEFRVFVVNDWALIKENLELVNVKKPDGTQDYGLTYNKFEFLINTIYNDTFKTQNELDDAAFVDFTNIQKFDNIENYEIIVPVQEFAQNRNTTTDKSRHNDALFLEIKGKYGNKGVTPIINALKDEVIIVNSGYGAYIFDKTLINSTNRQDILVHKDSITLYLNKIKSVLADWDVTKAENIIKNKQDVFGTDSDEVIKLQLYKTCKNVYDKWIGNATDGENIIFQCGGVGTPTRHTLDNELANKRGDSIAKLIDSFRFVTRSFRDIGDDFFIDPRPVSTYLTDNPNASFYGCITDLLASNNFDFIALPSFINYNDKETMESIFDTYTYQESIKEGICGPSFVCVYVGQKSKHLDFQGSDYTNDGFDIQCDSNGGMKQTLPKDFTNKSSNYENDVAVFKVGYSQQNQNIFKDITLDQSEFTETEESLKIIDDISKTGSENQRHFGGQNLYSVYGVRSYKAEVEMMGNAMIQPMMYFQLDNIPMFHGAYLITHVKHSIVPNSMSTNFTGVRVRHPETPILDAAELYMSLLENIDITATNTIPSNIQGPCVTKQVPSSIKCGLVKKLVYSFEDILKIIIDNLEGAYCTGASDCGSSSSGETLWGLDRLNFGSGGITKSNFDSFWDLVDKESKVGWGNTLYPKPNDKPQIYTLYAKLINERYMYNMNSNSVKNLSHFSELKSLSESDGRLYINFIYANVFNGVGFFEKFMKMLNKAYDEGNTTSDELAKIFVDDRINCLQKTWPSLNYDSKVLIGNSGAKIGKLVGFYC